MKTMEMYQIEENRNIKVHYMILALIFDKKGKKKKKYCWTCSRVWNLQIAWYHCINADFQMCMVVLCFVGECLIFNSYAEYIIQNAGLNESQLE